MGGLYHALATEQHNLFANAPHFCQPDLVDGLHLDVENTRNLGRAIAQILAKKGFAELQ